jgi:hypothetical protein
MLICLNMHNAVSCDAVRIGLIFLDFKALKAVFTSERQPD